MSKIIVIDWSIFTFRAIFAWRNTKQIPATWMCMNMLVSCFKKIGLKKDDIVYLACDGRHSWRKDYEKSYKENRKEFRESFTDINWDFMFSSFNELLQRLDKSMDWNVLQLESIESDDIASVVCKYNQDKEIILISYDADWEQMWNYPNVKIWSILAKYNSSGGKGAYKIKPDNFNVYKLISQKIYKEKSDNLTNPILNEQDYATRELCISLLQLPQNIEDKILEAIKNLPQKERNLDLFPYQGNLRNKLELVYEGFCNDEIITYEDCINKQLKKKLKKKSKIKKEEK